MTTKNDTVELWAEVLRKAEASRFLGISRRTLDDWMSKGTIPFVKLPSGAVRFRRSHLLDFLDRYKFSGKGGSNE